MAIAAFSRVLELDLEVTRQWSMGLRIVAVSCADPAHLFRFQLMAQINLFMLLGRLLGKAV